MIKSNLDAFALREGLFTVYNFNVEGIPTYFVSEHHILVHNIDCTGIAQKFQKKMGGGEIITAEPARGIVLPEPPKGYGDSDPWHYHDVFVKDEMVYDPMGWGDAPVPFDEWRNYYGDDVKISKGPKTKKGKR